MAKLPSTSIVITAKPKKALPVTLLGKDYMIKPPKTSLLLLISEHSEAKGGEPGVISRDFDNILKLMFSVKKGQFDEIKARLGDPEDDLDLDHIFEAVEAVTAGSSGDPTS